MTFGLFGLELIERTVNHVFDDLDDTAKAPLVGKVLRIYVGKIVFGDVLFDVSFEPHKAYFEPVVGLDVHHKPADCTLSVANPKELLTHLTGTDVGDVSGDACIIDEVRHIIATHPKSQALIDRCRFYL